MNDIQYQIIITIEIDIHKSMLVIQNIIPLLYFEINRYTLILSVNKTDLYTVPVRTNISNIKLRKKRSRILELLLYATLSLHDLYSTASRSLF